MGFFSGDTDLFRKFVPVTVSFTLDDMLPALDERADKLITSFLGQTLGDQLQGLASSADPLDPATNRALIRGLQLMRRAIACIGFADYLPFAEVLIENSGISVSVSGERRPAFDYQTQKLEKKLLESGWGALDELISLVASQPILFPGWSSSPYQEEFEDALIATPAEFSNFYGIQNRWLTFWALRPSLRALEADRGQSAQAAIDALPNTVSDAAKKTLGNKLRRALAYQTVIDALPALRIEIAGVNLQLNYGTQFGTAQYYQPPSRDDLIWFQTNLQNQASLFWSGFESALTAATPITDSTTSSVAPSPISCGGMTML